MVSGPPRPGGAGLTAAGFGAGSAITIVPISQWIATSGYQSAFIVFGVVQGLVVMIVSLALVKPPAAAAAQAWAEVDLTPAQVLRHPAFWMMYAMFVMVGAGGLMATAQLAVIAKDFGVSDVPVSLLGLPLSSLLQDATGNWHAVFYVAAAVNLVAALMAILVLKPMRRTRTRPVAVASPAE